MATIHSVGYDLLVLGDFSTRRDRWFVAIMDDSGHWMRTEFPSQAEALAHACSVMLADVAAEQGTDAERLQVAR